MALDNCTALYFRDDHRTDSYMVYLPIDRTMTYYVIPVICVFGILCNAAFIIVVHRVPFMRTPTSCYLVQLAVADILYLMSSSSARIVLYSMTPFRYDIFPLGFVTGCILRPAFSYISYFASLFFITSVTFDRYIAICRPLQARLRTSTKRSRLSVAFWVLAVVAAACLLPAFYTVLPVVIPCKNYPREIMVCQSDFFPEWVSYVRNALRTLPFFVSLVVNAVMYASIVRAMQQRSKLQDTLVTSSQRNAIDRMVLTTGGLFFLLLSPLESYYLVETITETIGIHLLTFEQKLTILWVFKTLIYTNVAINPIVYNITNWRYRIAFKKVFCCQKDRRKIGSNNIFTVELALQNGSSVTPSTPLS
ncbi:thyrotropin-releasing hormone receptor-like [Patiria miniata]|uniref:G-protein coupled receptors family 1 profile domain-containing protein n=1 Tax=Patiria miniata TaxID=46514 RepID=A0A913ZKR3_PATMI|nr:thyrotropin-releasing hormone receptor-like [Patiria miniata]